MDEEHEYAVSGNSCPRGAEYGKRELVNPTRVVTSTVKLRGGAYPRCPVKTDAPIPKALVLEAMRRLDGVELTAPVKVGDKVVEDLFGTGVNFVVTREL